MKKKESIASKISSWIFIIILLIIVYKLFGLYKLNYFNGFIKAEANLGVSKFIRDNEVKYSEDSSYKIISENFNDAAFYKEIEVIPDTVYKISCMVKTENVLPKSINTDGGANIGLIEGEEASKSIVGTTDWQKVELCFNSKARTTIKIGFRLGGNLGQATGTAWFSDFKLEKGIKDQNSNWNVACFIFNNIDVNINGEDYKFQMSTSDIETVKSNMQRFQTSCKNLTKGKMTVSYNIYEIDDTITTISYSDEYGYYIDPYDVNKYIEDIVLDNEYDYIFITLRMGNEEKQIPVKDWIGLRKYELIWNRLF